MHHVKITLTINMEMLVQEDPLESEESENKFIKYIDHQLFKELKVTSACMAIGATHTHGSLTVSHYNPVTT